jgi:hypothetical protein
LDEVITGDIPRPTKYSSPEAISLFKKFELLGMKTLLDNLGYHTVPLEESSPEKVRLERIRVELIENWSNAKVGREGLVVALADLAAVAYKIWEEVIIRSNLALLPHCRNMPAYIEEIKLRVNTEFNDFVDAKVIILHWISDIEGIVAQGLKRDDPHNITIY